MTKKLPRWKERKTNYIWSRKKKERKLLCKERNNKMIDRQTDKQTNRQMLYQSLTICSCFRQTEKLLHRATDYHNRPLCLKMVCAGLGHTDKTLHLADRKTDRQNTNIQTETDKQSEKSDPSHQFRNGLLWTDNRVRQLRERQRDMDIKREKENQIPPVCLFRSGFFWLCVYRQTDWLTARQKNRQTGIQSFTDRQNEREWQISSPTLLKNGLLWVRTDRDRQTLGLKWGRQKNRHKWVNKTDRQLERKINRQIEKSDPPHQFRNGLLWTDTMRNREKDT